MNNTIIIGAGPGGASAAIYLARFCHEVTLIDAGEAVAGRTGMATSLRNFLGNSLQTPGPEFLSRIDNQLKHYEIERISATVSQVKKTDEGFIVTADNKEYRSRYLVTAVGLSDNMPEIEGLDPYYDTSIFHCLTCDWYDHKDQKIAVVANDDKGITTALVLNHLHRPPALVVVPAKTPSFSEGMLQKAESASIIVYQSPLKELKGILRNLKSVILEDGTEVETDTLFTKLGHEPLDSFLENNSLNIERDEERFVKVDFKTFESSEKNLFAVGPCNDGPDQAIIAGGEGAMAAMEIHRRILDEAGL